MAGGAAAARISSSSVSFCLIVQTNSVRCLAAWFAQCQLLRRLRPRPKARAGRVSLLYDGSADPVRRRLRRTSTSRWRSPTSRRPKGAATTRGRCTRAVPPPLAPRSRSARTRGTCAGSRLNRGQLPLGRAVARAVRRGRTMCPSGGAARGSPPLDPERNIRTPRRRRGRAL